MKKLLQLASALLLVFALITFPQNSNATTYTIGGTMNGLEEVPSNNSPGTGVMSGDYDDVTNIINFTVVFSGLQSNTINAHFHAPAPPGQNSPVAISWSRNGFPLGVTSGTYSHQFTFTAQQEIWLLSGLMYTNIHTASRPGGEIRAQIATASNNKILNLSMFIQGFYDPAANTMVPDTVTVYLRGGSAPYTIADSAKKIVSSAGSGTFIFTNASDGIPYYIHIKHRNSIETWSDSTKSFGSSSLTYDFTTALGKAFGSNQIQADNTPVRFAIYNGDVNQNGTVDVADLSLVDNDAFNFVSGYVPTDVTGNNVTDATDLAIIDNNAFNFVGKITPP